MEAASKMCAMTDGSSQ